jgi:hypothetical protein
MSAQPRQGDQGSLQGAPASRQRRSSLVASAGTGDACCPCTMHTAKRGMPTLPRSSGISLSCLACWVAGYHVQVQADNERQRPLPVRVDGPLRHPCQRPQSPCSNPSCLGCRRGQSVPCHRRGRQSRFPPLGGRTWLECPSCPRRAWHRSGRRGIAAGAGQGRAGQGRPAGVSMLAPAADRGQ